MRKHDLTDNIYAGSPVTAANYHIKLSRFTPCRLLLAHQIQHMPPLISIDIIRTNIVLGALGY